MQIHPFIDIIIPIIISFTKQFRQNPTVTLTLVPPKNLSFKKGNPTEKNEKTKLRNIPKTNPPLDVECQLNNSMLTNQIYIEHQCPIPNTCCTSQLNITKLNQVITLIIYIMLIIYKFNSPQLIKNVPHELFSQ